MALTNKLERAQYFYAVLFILTTTSILKAINLGFLRIFSGFTEGLIKKHLENFMSTTLRHLHMRMQGLKLTRDKPRDTDLEDKCKTNVVL